MTIGERKTADERGAPSFSGMDKCNTAAKKDVLKMALALAGVSLKAGAEGERDGVIPSGGKEKLEALWTAFCPSSQIPNETHYNVNKECAIAHVLGGGLRTETEVKSCINKIHPHPEDDDGWVPPSGWQYHVLSFEEDESRTEKKYWDTFIAPSLLKLQKKTRSRWDSVKELLGGGKIKTIEQIKAYESPEVETVDESPAGPSRKAPAKQQPSTKRGRGAAGGDGGAAEAHEDADDFVAPKKKRKAKAKSVSFPSVLQAALEAKAEKAAGAEAAEGEEAPPGAPCDVPAIYRKAMLYYAEHEEACDKLMDAALAVTAKPSLAPPGVSDLGSALLWMLEPLLV